MKTFRNVALFAAFVAASALFSTVRADEPKPADDPMSPEYWAFWNDDVQKEIDDRIEKHRKSDYRLEIQNVKPGSTVKVEQTNSKFLFGAHIFNFDQLGSDEANSRYRELYGTLFNMATVAFYWKKFEPTPGAPRFGYPDADKAEYWNAVAEPKKETHWRRPAPDPVVDFLESKNLQITGHTIIWGNRQWQHPDWLPTDPAKVDEMETLFAKRIKELAAHYGDRIDRWDVVNESAEDFQLGKASRYGLMPNDYAFKAFKVADEAFPKSVEFNINDYSVNDRYAAQVADLQKRGARIDNVGIQMHLFNPAETLGVAQGKPIQTPAVQKARLGAADKTGLPLILSEITITAPGGDDKGKAIQAVVARNLYRYWFSWPTMRGIVWWNVVDDCGAPGEPTTSGLFTRQMEPKPSYFALNRLITEEWRTNFEAVAETSDFVKEFHGFQGTYRATFTDVDGNVQTKEFTVD